MTQPTVDLTQVTMLLGDQDIANTEAIQRATNAGARAVAVSIALSLTAFLIDRIKQGDELLLRHRDGVVERITMQELSDG